MFKIPKPPRRAVHIRMKIPPDATIVKNEKLTPIQIIPALSCSGRDRARSRGQEGHAIQETLAKSDW